MELRSFKTQIYSVLAEMTRALANPHRLEMLELPAQGAASVESIATETGLSIANTSQQLQTLKKARLVTSRKNGNYRYYELSSTRVFRVWMELRQLGHLLIYRRSRNCT